MGNPAGLRRDFDALEERRLRAAALLQKGLSEAEVARKVGMHGQSVNRWAAQLSAAVRRPRKRVGWRDGGRAWRSEVGLKGGSGGMGSETRLGTGARVADLIERSCGVRYHPGHVWRMLGRLGWSCQRPTGRALERDEEAIRRWKR